MFQTIRRSLTATLVLVAFFATAAQGQSQGQRQRQSQSHDLTSALQSHFQDAGFNGSVIVTRDGAEVWSGAFGMADFENGVPNTTLTKFRLGSVTKQFTAMAIMILQEQGLLSVDQAVGELVAGLPEIWRPLTLHQLLNHTSGIMHSWALSDFRTTMAVPTTLDATLARFHDQPLLFEPGSQWSYSGTGYFLLAKVVEEISGMSYAAFLQREIFEPLEMYDSGQDRPGPIMEHRARGYLTNQQGTRRNAPTIFMPILTGGGDLFSTVEDLARWGRALSERRLISDAGYEAMYAPGLNDYAYGWFVQDVRGVPMIHHGGAVPGFVTRVVQIPGSDLFVAAVTNAPTPALGPAIRGAIDLVLARSGS